VRSLSCQYQRFGDIAEGHGPDRLIDLWLGLRQFTPDMLRLLGACQCLRVAP
jgi:hypothetical protein